MGALKCAVVLGIVYSVVYIMTAVVLNIPYVLAVPIITHGAINIVNLAIDFITSFISFMLAYALVHALITHMLSK